MAHVCAFSVAIVVGASLVRRESVGSAADAADENRDFGSNHSSKRVRTHVCNGSALIVRSTIARVHSHYPFDPYIQDSMALFIRRANLSPTVPGSIVPI